MLAAPIDDGFYRRRISRRYDGGNRSQSGGMNDWPVSCGRSHASREAARDACEHSLKLYTIERGSSGKSWMEMKRKEKWYDLRSAITTFSIITRRWLAFLILLHYGKLYLFSFVIWARVPSSEGLAKPQLTPTHHLINRRT